MKSPYFEILYKISTCHFGTTNFFLHQVLWGQQQWDEILELLFKVRINVCVWEGRGGGQA